MGEAIFETIIPFITAGLVNDIRNGTDIRELLGTGLLLVIMACASLVCGGLAGFTCSKASAGFAGNLRHDLYYSVQNYSFSNIDKFSTSSLVTRLTTDVTNVQNAFMTIIRMGVRAPLMMICSFTFSLSAFATIGKAQLDSMTTVYLIVVPVLLVGLGTLMAIAMPMFNRIFKRYDALNESVQENIKGMRVVKAYVREDFEKQKLQDLRIALRLARGLYALYHIASRFCMSFLQRLESARMPIGLLDGAVSSAAQSANNCSVKRCFFRRQLASI